MKRQLTDWGYIDWLEEDMTENRIALNVGLVTIFPHAHMNPHIHFTEQVLYTLGGSGYSLVNGKKIDMTKPHMILHWEASVIHEMFNTGDEEFRHLMVSCPDTVKFDTIAPDVKDQEKISAQEAEEYLHAAIAGTCEQFLDTLHYSYVIFSASGVPVKRTRIFPEFCCRYCDEEISVSGAPCMCRVIKTPFYEEKIFECPYGATVFCVPVVFGGTFLGYIQGGYVHTHVVPDQDIYMMSQNAIDGAKILLRKIGKAITDYCGIYQLKKQIMDQENELMDAQKYQRVLTASLLYAKNTVIDLKINHHFLFNTLNQMASMALSGGMEPLYQSILNLSTLFSSSLRNNSSMVPLTTEYEYLNSYMQLQKFRYGDNLTILSSIDTPLERWKVPFNFLMPVAENAFIHGFSQEENKIFYLRIFEKESQLIFSMENNGVLLDETRCREIMGGMREGSTHGLSMLYQKLYFVYGEKFSIEFSPGQKDGALVVIRIPAEINDLEGKK